MANAIDLRLSISPRGTGPASDPRPGRDARRPRAASLVVVGRACALLCFLGLLVASGCATAYRVGASAVVNTAEQAALVANLGAALGFKTTSDSGLLLRCEGAAGPTVTRVGGLVSGSLGQDYVHQELRHAPVGLRIGLREAYFGWVDTEHRWRHEFGVGGALAVLLTLRRHRERGHEKLGGGGRSYDNLAFEFQGLFAFESTNGPALGTFILSIGYERNDIFDLF